MPRASLPSCLKKIASFPVVLTKDSEEQVYEMMVRMLEEWRDAQERRAEEDDRLLQLFFDTNPYLAWKPQAWRSRTEPRRGNEHEFMQTGRESHARWTWEEWRVAHSKGTQRVYDDDMEELPAYEPPAYQHAPRDYAVCCEAFPEWKEKQGWLDWERVLERTSYAPEEFAGIERAHYNLARDAWRKNDHAWIDYTSRARDHWKNADQPGHKCDFCAEATAIIERRKQDELAYEAKVRAEAEARAREEASQRSETPPPTPKPIEVLPPSPIVAHCELCSARFTSQSYYENHLASREHQQRVRLQERERAVALKQRMAELRQQELDLKLREREAREAKRAEVEARREEREAERKQHAVEKEGQKVWRCEGCRYETPYKQSLERHLTSSLHMKRSGSA